ncbi:excisionase [Peptostreptococcus stomatis]|uniref:excisionase n=1 Tax=Peptostreptococcus stomatis TaxID=341694 RepID=UPI0028E254DF|nr:excisionase [Peptostreptococcus stomatis]
MKKINEKIPLWEKSNLTISEASEYFNIGMHRLRELTEDENCEFVLFVGSKKLIKKRKFELYLENQYSI